MWFSLQLITSLDFSLCSYHKLLFDCCGFCTHLRSILSGIFDLFLLNRYGTFSFAQAVVVQLSIVLVSQLQSSCECFLEVPVVNFQWSLLCSFIRNFSSEISKLQRFSSAVGCAVLRSSKVLIAAVFTQAYHTTKGHFLVCLQTKK